MCNCQPNWDIRCVCNPIQDGKSFLKCPERERYIYHGMMTNEIDLYRVIESGTPIQEAVTTFFEEQGYDLPPRVDWEQLNEWWSDDYDGDDEDAPPSINLDHYELDDEDNKLLDIILNK